MVRGRPHNGRRKSPIEHTVKSHSRLGNPVRAFTRGQGSRPQKPQRSRVVGEKSLPTNELAFTVNLTYSDKPGDGESVIVIADAPGDQLDEETYRMVLDEAFEERVDTRPPIAIEMEDPSLDAVLSFIGEHAKKAGAYGLKTIKKGARVGAKYAIRAVKAGTRYGVAVTKAGAKAVGGATKAALTESSRLALYEIERAKARLLIKRCYSSDPVERDASRDALKRLYPDIYKICSFSRG